MESFTQTGIFKTGSEAFNFGGQLISLEVVKLISTFRQKFRDQNLHRPNVKRGCCSAQEASLCESYFNYSFCHFVLSSLSRL